MQSLQVKRKQFLKSAIMILFLILLKRKLFTERGEPEQSCKLETLLQKFHPLWREKQVEQKTFFSVEKSFSIGEKIFNNEEKILCRENISLVEKSIFDETKKCTIPCCNCSVHLQAFGMSEET